MNAKLSKLMTVALIFAAGMAVDHVYSSERYTELFATKSGTFVIRNGRIFELAELEASYAPTEKGYSNERPSK